MIIKFFFIFYFLIFLDKKPKLQRIAINTQKQLEKNIRFQINCLTSISLVESGLKKGENFLFLALDTQCIWKIKVFDKNETVNYLKKKTIIKKNIDVGCMQISLKYHGQIFENFNQILDLKVILSMLQSF